MESEIKEFVSRRFKEDRNWLDGNCYYFAVILSERFDFGEIWYDVVMGHFVYGSRKHGYYDWNGRYYASDKYLVEWDKFKEYDELQYKRIVDSCIK